MHTASAFALPYPTTSSAPETYEGKKQKKADYILSFTADGVRAAEIISAPSAEDAVKALFREHKGAVLQLFGYRKYE